MDIDALKSKLAGGKLPHAILLGGASFETLKAAADALGQAYLCFEGSEDAQACEVCISCRAVKNGTHPDFSILDAEDEAASIKIEQIRALIARTLLKPFLGNKKFFMLIHAERMTESAQNALLKILEEPPAGTTFALLTTRPEGLLDTVRSRCQTVSFSDDTKLSESDEDVRDAARKILASLNTDTDRGLAALASLSRPTLAQAMSVVCAELRQALRCRVGTDVASIGTLDFDEARCIEAIERVAQTREQILNHMNLKIALGALAHSES